jgi:hypothetical protein
VVHFGGDPLLASGGGFASFPALWDEVGDLSLNDRPVGPIGLCPTEVLLVGAGLLQQSLVGMDRDGAPKRDVVQAWRIGQVAQGTLKKARPSRRASG